MIGERMCSVCRRFLSRRLTGWTTDKHGAWVCPICSQPKERAA